MANAEPYDFSTAFQDSSANITVDDKPFYVYDGDTVINQETGERFRMPNYDTGELSRIGEEFGEMHIGSFTGPAEKEAVTNVINEGGFNRLVSTPDQTEDKYGRTVKDLVNESGESLSDYLQRERVVGRSKFMTKKQQDLRILGEFADRLKADGAPLSVGDKARELVNSVVVPEDRKIEMYGTIDDVIRGSSFEAEMFQTEINRLKKELDKTTDENERKEIMDEIVANQEYLTVSVNTPKSAVFSGVPSPTGGERQPGYWGESVNAAEKSIYMLSNTMGGFSAWLGDALNNEALENWGNDWALETNQDIRDAGYTTDFWSIRGPWDAMRFISSSIIQYTPQMGAIFASGYAGAKGGGLLGTALAPFTGGISVPAFAAGGAVAASTATAFMLAVSSVYQNQPEGEKDPLIAGAIAMPIALADRFGISKLANVNILTKEGKKEYIKIAKAEKGWDEKKAEEMLKGGMKEVMKESSDIMQNLANRQLLARRTFKDLATTSAKAGGIEAFTEATQQAIEEIGLAATTSIDMDYEALLYNMIESGAVGGVVGTTFNLPFSINEQERFNDAVYGMLPEDESLRTDISRWEEAHRTSNNNIKQSKLEVAAENKDKVQSLSEKADKAKKSSVWRDFISTMGNPKRFVQSYRGYFSDLYQTANGKVNFNMQKIGDLIGHINIFTGTTVTQEHRSLDSVLNSYIPNRAAMSRDIGIKEQELYTYLNMDESTLNGQGLSQGTLKGIAEVKNRFRLLGMAIQEEIKSRNKKGADINLSLNPGESITSYLNKFNDGKYFFNSKNIDYRKVDQNFRQLLSEQTAPVPKAFGKKVKPTGISDEEITMIMNEIRARDLSIDTRNRLESLGVFNKPEFTKYLSQSPFEDVTTMIRSLSKEVVMQTRFGKNGEVLSNLLEKAHKAGEINEQQMYDGAAVLADFMKMNRHTYRPIKNKVLRNIQDNMLFFSTLTYMDFNFFANMAEMTNGLIGLTPKQMWTYMKTGGGVFAKQVANDLRRVAATTGVVKDRTKRELADSDIRFERGVLAGTIAPKGSISILEGVDVTVPAYQNFLNHFWNWNQVESQTNAVRSARSALAWENISKFISIVADEDNVITGRSREARDHLIYYGLDPDRMVYFYKKTANVTEGNIINKKRSEFIETNIIGKENLDNLTPEERSELHEAYKVGLIRFTDELVVRPEPGSTPKIIEDPRFALFTQFKRFIAHFTANVIPRVWSGYIKSNKPGMTRNAFTVIVAAYAMAMLSQMIKDSIVYGEKAPWLEDDEEDPDWLRTSYARGAAYTGWGGTPLMAVEFINEMSRNSGRKPPLENFFESLIGESPMLNTIYSDLNTRKTIGETIAKRAPFFGDIKDTRETIAELIDSIGK